MNHADEKESTFFPSSMNHADEKDLGPCLM
jgi:hypothetical protein